MTAYLIPSGKRDTECSHLPLQDTGRVSFQHLECPPFNDHNRPEQIDIKRSHDKPRQSIKKQRHPFANKGLYSQSHGFSSSYVRVWELNHKEGWSSKNLSFWIAVLEKALESPLGCKEIKPVNPKGNQPWIFIRRTNAKAETPILWPPDGKSWLIGKYPDAG